MSILLLDENNVISGYDLYLIGNIVIWIVLGLFFANIYMLILSIYENVKKHRCKSKEVPIDNKIISGPRVKYVVEPKINMRQIIQQLKNKNNKVSIRRTKMLSVINEVTRDYD